MVRFLLTRPMRDVTLLRRRNSGPCLFLLTRPMRDVTIMAKAGLTQYEFLLTRPMRDVTPHEVYTGLVLRHFYSHVPCGT